jgi:cardiolipin synthase
VTGRVLTIPNALTLARGLAAVPVAIAILQGWFFAALAVVFLAGLTDGLDGAVARRTGQTSDVGRLLDPISDKLLLVTTFVASSVPGRGFEPLPIWLVSMAVLRDVGLVVVAYLVYRATGFTGFRPSMLGKINTVVELGLVVLFLTTRAFGLPEVLLTLGIYLTAGSILASGLHYVVHLRRLLAEAGRDVGVGAV